MPLSEKQLCNLHIALSDMLPLPEQLIQFVVNGLFNIENWEATDDDGFYVDNIKADDLDLEESQFYVYQSQIWSQLSQNEYGDLDDDESKSNYQNKFNSHKDEDIISSIIQKIQDCRFDALSKFSVDIKPETLVDALLNIDLEYRNEEDLPELHAGTVSIISGIEDLAEAYQFGILLAMLNQVELVPTGPLVKIRKKKPESKTSVYIPEEAKSKFTLIEHIFRLIQDNQYKDDMPLPKSIKKLGMSLEHIKLRVSYTNAVLIFLEEQEQYDILVDRIKIYLEDRDGWRTDEIVTSHHIKDLLVFLMIRGSAAQRVGIKQMDEYFSQLIELNENDKNLVQSIEFNRDNLLMDSRERTEKLRKHSEKANSKFLSGLVDYVLGSSLPVESQERYERLLKSITVFQSIDSARLASSASVLVGGSIDYKDDYGNPVRSQPDIRGNFPQRLVLILNNLIHYSKGVVKLVLFAIEDYLISRISKHRQRCDSCDYPHIWVYKTELEISVDELSEIRAYLKNIEETFAMSDSDLIVSINEILDVILVSILGVKEIESKEKCYHKVRENITLSLENPIEFTLDRYDFAKIPTKQIYERLGSLILHLQEPMYDEQHKLEIVDRLKISIEELLNDCTEPLRYVMLSFVNDCLVEFSMLESSGWYYQFRFKSLEIMDRLLPDRSKISNSESDFVMTIASHADHLDIYDIVSKNPDARLEHSDILIDMMFEYTHINELNRISDPVGIAKNSRRIAELVNEINSNDNLELIRNVSTVWEHIDERFTQIKKLTHKIPEICSLIDNLEMDIDDLEIGLESIINLADRAGVFDGLKAENKIESDEE